MSSEISTLPSSFLSGLDLMSIPVEDGDEGDGRDAERDEDDEDGMTRRSFSDTHFALYMKAAKLLLLACLCSLQLQDMPRPLQPLETDLGEMEDYILSRCPFSVKLWDSLDTNVSNTPFCVDHVLLHFRRRYF